MSMITIAWYNVVAIIVGILWIVWLKKVGEDDRYGIGSAMVILAGIAFFAIWGGIFWW